MTPEIGRREAHKNATRRAIQEAADRLFATQGFADTTVREIADAAGVTERTFFRYFGGKEALLVDDIRAWLPSFGDAIRERPVDEEPLDAIESAIQNLGGASWDAAQPNLSMLFLDGPPAGRLVSVAPSLLLQFEQVIADALSDRRRGNDDPDEFADQVLARTAVAALRSAAIREWQLRIDGRQDRPTLAELVRHAFAVLRAC